MVVIYITYSHVIKMEWKIVLKMTLKGCFSSPKDDKVAYLRR